MLYSSDSGTCSPRSSCNQPGGFLGFFEIEQAGIEYFIQRHFAEAGGLDARAWIEAAQDGMQMFVLLTGNQIQLVQNDHVAEFNLFNQQIDHGALIFFTQRFAAFAETVLRAVIAQEIEGVDYRHHGIESRYIRKTDAIFIGKGECFSDWQRL